LTEHFVEVFWAAVSASLCLACSSSAEHCCRFIKCFFEQINKQTNKTTRSGCYRAFSSSAIWGLRLTPAISHKSQHMWDLFRIRVV